MGTVTRLSRMGGKSIAGPWLGGYRVRVLAPEPVAPRWWEVFRCAGLRSPRMKHSIPAGQVLVNHELKTVFVRPDYFDVLNGNSSPPLQVDNITDISHRLRVPPPARL